MKFKWAPCIILLISVAFTAQLFGQKLSAEPATRFAEVKLAAENGDATAQFILAVYYEKGFGVPTNSVQSVNWYRKAAEQGDAQAQNSLGMMYYTGHGVEKNSAEAVKWFRKAADQGNAIAQHNLNVMHDNGKVVEKDSAEAFQRYHKAAEQGDAQAQFSLGVMYIKGDGVEKNSAETVKWFREAAEQGLAEAQYNLGVMYANGEGGEKDSAIAVKWYQNAAEQGVAKAQYQLGRHYYFGDGVLVDYAEAVKWNALAAAQGNEDAVNMWNYVLKEKVPAEQIAEGQQLAKHFVPHTESSRSSTLSTSSSPAATNLPKTQGTGFFITEDGYLISNNHVIKDASKVQVVTSAGTFDAKVIQTDAANDLALLKAKGHFSSLPIAPSRKVQLGSTVATVGFPDPGLQGFSPKLAKGEIASLSGAADDARYFQISVPVQPGNSGGALVDENGNVVGIVSAKLNASAALASSGSLPENVNYAIKSSYLLSFLESVPAVSAKLKDPLTADRKFEDVVKSAQDAAVLVLIY